MSLFNFFISNAYADVAPPNAAGGGFSFGLMLIILAVFIYFGILRPQSKRAREQQNILTSLAKGDEVMLAGGMLGRIQKISDQYLVLGIANNVDIVVQKTAVINILPKGTIKSVE